MRISVKKLVEMGALKSSETCSFCGQFSFSKMQWHHWEEENGTAHIAKVCIICNHLLNLPRMEREFGGFPPKEIQIAYCRAYRKARNGEAFEKAFEEEMKKRGIELLKCEEDRREKEDKGMEVSRGLTYKGV